MGRTHPKGERDYAAVSTNSQAGRPKRCSKLLSVQSTTTKRAIGAKALSWTYRRASCGVVTMKNSATNRMTTSATRAKEVERAWAMDMVAPIRKMEPCPNGTKAPMGGRKADGRYAGRCRCAVARRIGRILPRLPTTFNTTTPTASRRRAGQDDLPHGGDSPRPSDVARPLLGSPDWNSPAQDRP